MLISSWLRTCLTSRSAYAWASTFLQGGVTSRGLAVAYSVEKQQLKKVFLFSFACFCAKHENSTRSCSSCDDLTSSWSFATNVKISTRPLTSKCHTQFPFLCYVAFVYYTICTGRYTFCSTVAQCGEFMRVNCCIRGKLFKVQRLLNIESDNFCCWHMYMWLSLLYRSKLFKGPILYPFSCLYFSSWVLLEQPQNTKNDQK